MATSLATLNTWLDEAMAAKQKFLTGAKAVKVTGPAGSVEFSATKMADLDAWINTLRGWIAAGGVSTTTSGRRPIGFGF